MVNENSKIKKNSQDIVNHKATVGNADKQSINKNTQENTKDARVNKGITVKKSENFSEWYTQLLQKAELVDIRYNVKGTNVILPWAVYSIKKIYSLFERVLESKGHEPLIMPSLIPESNFKLEAEHVEGFTPQVYWVTEVGNGVKLDERLALRPTSETALYRMYSKWIRSYKDLPFKRYQSCQVWRYEGKATRPLFRDREFHWIEAHNVFATMEDAKRQTVEDMETTKEVLSDILALPIIFFQRPEWDKFAGAIHTFAADALMDSGRVIQLPSTHLLGTNFSKPFDVKFVDKDGEEKYGYITCYGPAITRIYGAMIALLGDDKGLVLPFDVAPVKVVIVPIVFKDNDKAVAYANELKDYLLKSFDSIRSDFKIIVDDRTDLTPGEKFNYWELKGVPIRVEVGPKEVENSRVTLVVRYNSQKIVVDRKDVVSKIKEISENYTNELKKLHSLKFSERVVDCDSLDDLKKVIDDGKIGRIAICSTDLDGEECAKVIEEETGGLVRGTNYGEDPDKVKEELKGKKCIVCGKPANAIVYVAKSY